MGSEDQKESPRDPKSTLSSPNCTNSIFSPRFRSVAAMAGWDEEALLSASLIVDDTPDREHRSKKRSEFQFKTPPSSSRRKRRAQRSPVSAPFIALDLDDGETTKTETKKDSAESTSAVDAEKGKIGEAKLAEQNFGVVPSSSSSSLPCMDRLREELSCAICLDICFEPTTTPCGHSFCLKCLRSSASKCGKKCPKCRQLISNGRSCTVNTVLWNTIQLLFPQEVEARKAAGALNSREAQRRITETAFYNNLRNGSSQDSQLPTSRTESARRRRVRPIQDVDSTVRPGGGVTSNRASRVSSRESSSRSSRAIPSQDEDAALALRLQREEFLGAVRGTINQSSTLSLSLAAMRTSSQTSRSSSLSVARENQPSSTSSSLSLARADQSSTSISLSSARENQSSTSSFSLARANLRAMASRAITLRVRGRNNM
ncbi:TNF receptor-associated factor [Parasponia andersonii]|uniref:TNF receptor-associated factor n=1 Tax=Parasponia andersonii TaxID=3476 RepID=A0A2P5B5G8_PARAD|nr:TNF receptor-associated factor [Parasponia andersonii]